MAIAPLQIPQANINSSADFTPLAGLGEVYKRAQNERKLSDLGKQLAGGSIDYRSAAGQVADMGDINSTLKFLALSEQEKQRARQQQASLEFSGGLGGMFGGQPATPAQRIMPAPSAGEGLAPDPTVSTPSLFQPAAVTSTPAGARVQPTDKVWGTDEAEAAGLYETPKGPQVAQAAPQAAPPAAPTPQALPSMAEGPKIAHVPLLLRAISNPDLPEAQRDIAKDLFKRALDDAKPNERIKFLTDLSEQSGFKGTPLELEMMLRKSGAGNVNVDTQGQNAFAKEGGQVLAKRFGKLSEEGEVGSNDIAMVGQLRDLRQNFKTGGKAAAQGWLAEYGIKVGKDVSEIEAYNSIINKLTPSQRVPGSGATSDYEDKLFKSALPRLINTPGGNDIIDQTMTGLAQHKMERGRIAELALAGEITPKDAMKRLRDLPSPYENFKTFARGGFKAATPAPTAATQPRRMTEEEFNKAPSGTPFIDPEGNLRNKP